jgi:small-conductance mechanosensitive channel/uncharacterized coiled-coil DUF342 family protein
MSSRTLFVVLFGLYSLGLHSQIDTALKPIVVDPAVREILEDKMLESSKMLKAELNERSIISRQNLIFDGLRTEFQKARDYLEPGIDTVLIEKGIEKMQEGVQTALDGIFYNKGTIQTSRNLATSSSLLLGFEKKLEIKKRQIDRIKDHLEGFRNRIDSVASDTLLFYLPQDSAEVQQYIDKVASIRNDFGPTEKKLDAYLKQISDIQVNANVLIANVRLKREEIRKFQKDLSGLSFKRELANIYGPVGYVRPFDEILHYSAVKGLLVLIFYVENHIFEILLLILILYLMHRYLRSLKRNILAAMVGAPREPDQNVLKSPLLAASVITLTIGQFIFPSPPFIFDALIWILITLMLARVIWHEISSFWRIFLLILSVLFIATCGLNLILQASRIERELMLVLSSISFLLGIAVLFARRKSELRQRGVILFILVFVIFMFVSIPGNILGRYNLSKALFSAGIFNIVVGLHLLWTMRFLNELFKISAEAYREDEKQRYYIDFERISKETPVYLYYMVILGWFVLVGRNFYIYEEIASPIKKFLREDYVLGSIAFSILDILIFAGILLVAAVSSKLISYFASTSENSETDNVGHGIGRWVLLIRILVVSAGVLLAFAATGIPLDKVAIIFGALSVGIGFGLQGLVNNLVSGLIIAFEKPLNIGDVVEIAGQNGTMKSIGFRSSTITSFDGADVIIPNGDLLNNHLINWTLSSKFRRVEVLVGVNYGTNLEEAIAIILEILDQDRRVRRTPEPLVYIKEFAASSIDLRILFWVHQKFWVQTRSDTIKSIKDAFEKAEIEIPYPQIVVNQAKESNTASSTIGGRDNSNPSPEKK